MRRGKIIGLFLLFLIPVYLTAQITTGSFSGMVRSGNEALGGATIKALHIPTGTEYNSSSLGGGVFNIVNLIPGGPYHIEVSFIGYQTYMQDSIYLSLGENTRVDANLIPSASGLKEVVVTGTSLA